MFHKIISNFLILNHDSIYRELSGLVVECLTRDRRANQYEPLIKLPLWVQTVCNIGTHQVHKKDIFRDTCQGLKDTNKDTVCLCAINSALMFQTAAPHPFFENV